MSFSKYAGSALSKLYLLPIRSDYRTGFPYTRMKQNNQSPGLQTPYFCCKRILYYYEVLRSGNPVPSDYMPWIHMFHPAEPSYKDIPPRRNNPASYRSVFQIPYLLFPPPHSELLKIRPDRFSVSCCKPVSALPNTLLPACVLNP